MYYKPKRGSEESKALTQLKKLKVYQISALEDCQTFDDVWYRVAFETDMFECYDTQAEYNEYFGSTEGLTFNSFKSACKWLDDTKHLCTE